MARGRILAAVVGVAVAAAPAAGQLQIEVNATKANEAGAFNRLSSVGWYYTPTSTFFLEAIRTRFNTTAPNVDRPVTVELWSDRPAVGGTLLRSASFQSNTALGIFGGGSFSPILFEAGISYFIGFRNIQGLGYNRTLDPTAELFGNHYSSLGPNFGDDLFERGAPREGQPILELEGAAVSVVPEPVTMTLLASGLAAMGAVGYLKRRRGRRPPA